MSELDILRKKSQKEKDAVRAPDSECLQEGKRKHFNTTAPAKTSTLSGSGKPQAQPIDCPRFTKCSAPICLLDSEWRKRTHLKDERICYFLRAYAKGHEIVNFGGVYTELIDKLDSSYSEIKSHIAPLRKQLTKIEKAFSLDGDL